jgi:3-methyladenine DNA glycosylase AlkD
MDVADVIEQLRAMGSPKNVAGMATSGVTPSTEVCGIPIPKLRSLAKSCGRDHAFAQELWGSTVYEARIMASMVDVPSAVTVEQMERWVADFDTWELCDQTCSNLFDRTTYAEDKAFEWSERTEEFVRRAGLVIMATSAVHDKTAPDERFLGYIPRAIVRADDERKYVKKAASWALRQIGKRNIALHGAVLDAIEPLRTAPSRPARWVASDVYRELIDPRTVARVEAKGAKP